MRIAVIGGGAAGFFAALSAKEHRPDAEVILLEKSGKLLSKVRVSGGGRCNVTHACFNVRQLSRGYPRGERFLRKAFGRWKVDDTIAWFERRGVGLKTEEDGRMFPVTDRSATVIDALLSEARRAGVEVRMNTGARAIAREGKDLVVAISGEQVLHVDRVIVANGGSPKAESYAWLGAFGHTIVPPVPSLFTFNLEKPIAGLMGVVAEHVRVRIAGTVLEAEGPLLITHWGFSGPAVLRLSAWGARDLHAMQYRYEVRVNWIAMNENTARTALEDAWVAQPKRQAGNASPFALAHRLWHHLLATAGIDDARSCGEIGKHDRNRLLDVLVNDRHDAQGKTTFKEEFVTAGGVRLDEVDAITMESKRIPGLFFAGEVLDIDGITGGFNFQAAWTTGSGPPGSQRSFDRRWMSATLPNAHQQSPPRIDGFRIWPLFVLRHP